MFQNLSDRLQSIFSGLTGKGRLTEADVDAAMREIRMALLEADVNYKVVKEFVAKVRERAIGADVMKSLTPGQMVVKIVVEEMTELLGGTASQLVLSGRIPNVIMLVGLQGSGKTTATAKLANLLRKQGRRPLMVACDVYRPAAIDQLEALGRELDIPVYRGEGTDPVAIAKAGVKHAVDTLRDLVIVDTAGRLHVDEEMMNEAAAIKAAVRPDQILMVVDAMTGQDAVNVAAAFAEKVDFDGVIMSKLDGDARGGAALSIRQVTGKPIKFASLRREDRRPRGVPPRPHGQAHPRHGRRHLAHREGAGGRRRRDGRGGRGAAPQGRVHARRLPRPDQAGPQDGRTRLDHEVAAGSGQAQGSRRPGRRGRARPDRGHHLLDDHRRERPSRASSTGRAASESHGEPASRSTTSTSCSSSSRRPESS